MSLKSPLVVARIVKKGKESQFGTVLGEASSLTGIDPATKRHSTARVVKGSLIVEEKEGPSWKIVAGCVDLTQRGPFGTRRTRLSIEQEH